MFILFTLPRTIEGIWDLFNKLGFPITYDSSIKFIFSLFVGISLLLKKNHFEEFPTSYKKIMEFVYKN